VSHASFSINGPSLLRDFDVQELRTFLQPFLPKHFLPELRIVCHTSFPINGPSLLRDFGVSFSSLLKYVIYWMCVSRRSTVINCFGYSSFGSFNLSTLAFSRSAFTQVNDLSMRVSHRSMTTNHFGYSGFGSFNLSTLAFSQSDFTRSQRSVDACFPQIDSSDRLCYSVNFQRNSWLTASQLFQI
jgi:hypothetical protein